MGKKRLKKFSTFSNPSTTLNSLSDCSFHQDISAKSSHEVSSHFKVLLYHDTEDKNEYIKWTKNCCWKNIAFIQPSVDFGSFVLIEGKSTCAVFIAQPLKSVKNGSVVLMNDMGFINEEPVILHPLREDAYEAKDIVFTTESSLLRDSFYDMLVKKLSNKFIWCGLKLRFSLFDVKCECVVSKVLSGEEFSKSSHLVDVGDSSEKHISSLFSTLSLQNHASESVVSQASVNWFVTNHSSSVIMNDLSEELSFPLFKHLGGYHQQIEIIRNYIDTFLKNTSGTVEGCTHLLLLSGAKNMTVNAICNEYKIPTFKILMSSLNCQNLSAALEEMELVIKDANKNSPSFLVLDKLDLFCLLKSEDHVTNMFRHLNRICGDQILIIATLRSEFTFDKQLLNLFSVKEVKFTLPCTFDREEIIGMMLKEDKQELSFSQVKHLAKLLQGLSGRDIFKVLKFDAPLLSLIRMKNVSSSITPEISGFCDIKTAIKKRKSSLYSSDLKANKVKWSDIGGMETTKKELIEELELLTQTPKEKLKRFNYSPSRGLLLYGPPGCSKTMIAKALATECDWNFISKKASDIMNAYVGESEKAVTNLFLEARIKAPCIIFLDEIDAMAPSRNSSSAASGVQNRVVNCLLTEMAGIETLEDVIIIAATNRPDIIDNALLRQGRIGKLIYVPLPDHETRRELFRLSMKMRQVSDDVDFNNLIKRTEGYSGAEIVQLCNEAAMQLLIEDPDCHSPVLKNQHFENALLAVTPLTHKDTIHFYEQFGSKNC